MTIRSRRVTQLLPAGATVDGTADAPLGALAATATGTRTVLGSATAALGALTATATGTVTPPTPGPTPATGPSGGGRRRRIPNLQVGPRHTIVTGIAHADLGRLEAHLTGTRIDIAAETELLDFLGV